MSEERTYQWDTTPITLQIRLQPTTQDNAQRQVLIAATSYDDFPLAILVEQCELSDLLTQPIIRDLLEQLASELPIRRLRYQELHQKQSKSSKQRAQQASSPPELSPPLTLLANSEKTYALVVNSTMKRLRALSATLYPMACLPNFSSNKMRSALRSSASLSRKACSVSNWGIWATGL